MNALKSAVVVSPTRRLHLHIFTADGNDAYARAVARTWPAVRSGRVRYTVYNITLTKEWRELFKLCATQRLFFPQLLDASIRRVIYTDTDVVWLQDMGDLWQKFSQFNETTVAAVAPEGERAPGWYDRFGRHPYYKPLGVNSGVMLMDLERMRAFGWVEKVRRLAQTPMVATPMAAAPSPPSSWPATSARGPSAPSGPFGGSSMTFPLHAVATGGGDGVAGDAPAWRKGRRSAFLLAPSCQAVAAHLPFLLSPGMTCPRVAAACAPMVMTGRCAYRR